MKKLATILLSSALVGGLTLSAFAPAASAAESYRGNQRGNFTTQQQMQGPQGQNMRGNGMMQDGNGFGQDMRGNGFGPQRIGQAGLVHFACSVNGAPRLEIALNNLSDKLTLTDDQKTLFDAFKTSALTAQTTYADACQVPTANAGTPLDPVQALKLHQTNETADIAAIDSVLPSLEAFYNSLSDTQKADLATPVRANMQVGQGQFMQGQGRFGDDQYGPRGNFGGQNNGQFQNDFVPGQGNGPGNGQGLGPRNNG